MPPLLLRTAFASTAAVRHPAPTLACTLRRVLLHAHARRQHTTQNQKDGTQSAKHTQTETLPPAPGAYTPSPPETFLEGMSDLINRSRSTVGGSAILRTMAAQERPDMDSHMHVRQTTQTPITPSDVARNGQQQPEPPLRGTPRVAASPSSRPVANPRAQNPFPAIMPVDSFWSVSLPFHTDATLRDEYCRFDGGVRFERVLEDLDAFAGNVSNLHCKQGAKRREDNCAKEKAAAAQKGIYVPAVSALPALSIVTASVDSITMHHEIRFPLDRHLALQGCVTWVGNTSMEVSLEVRIVRDSDEWERMTSEERMAVASDPARLDERILHACFVMVARDSNTGKAAFVPPLAIERMNAADKARFERGEQSASRRKREAAHSLTRLPPTSDEIALIHQLLMPAPDSAAPASSGVSLSAAAPTTVPLHSAENLEIVAAPPGAPAGSVILRPRSVPMADTEISSSTMTQPQDRNTNGKVFGGVLMRQAFELARCCAYLFCGPSSRPICVAVDNISFLQPVEIGSIISYRAKVCYSAGSPDPAFQVRVETLVHEVTRGGVFPSNVFHFNFHVPRGSVRQVMPNTYREAVDFLDGKRRREKLAATFKAQEEEQRMQRESAAPAPQ